MHLTPRLQLWAFWAIVLIVILVIQCADFWSLKEVRDWMFGQTGAAWLQSIGSIGAIFVAFRLAQMQFESALAIERETYQTALHRRLASLLGLYAPVQEVMDNRWPSIIRTAVEWNDQSDHIEQASEILRVAVGAHTAGRTATELSACLEDVNPLDYGSAAAQVGRLKDAVSRLVLAMNAVEQAIDEPLVEFRRKAGDLKNALDWCIVCIHNVSRAGGIEGPGWALLHISRLDNGSAQSLL